MDLQEKRSLLHGSYQILWNWAENRGYQVIESSEFEDACWSDVKQITINARQGIEKRLYALLHECGHALIRSSWHSFSNQYPAHAHAEIKKQTNPSKSYRISVLEEEVEAWKRGLRLANRLGIYIDEEKYNQNKTHYLLTYAQWATE